MKKIIFALLVAFGINTLVAQSPTVLASIPYSIRKKFDKKYHNSNPNWRVEESNYTVECKNRKTKLGRTVIYDKNGTRIREDNEVGSGSFPPAIYKYCAQHFPDENYSVWASKDGRKKKVYYSKCKKQVAWFDKRGKHLPNGPALSKKEQKLQVDNSKGKCWVAF